MFKNSIFTGLLAAGTISAIAIMGYQSAPLGSSLETFFFALGGKMPEGIIQFASFAAFFTCLLEIRAVQSRLARENQALAARMLPETEQYVLYPEDVHRIKLDVIAIEARQGAVMLTDLIKQAATKFRAQQSTAETLTLVESVSEMQRQNVEKDFWLIHLCQTLIPAFGFLGTVWGMAAAILAMGRSSTLASATPGAAGQTISAGDISGLIDSLGTAFFTTIIAIVLGIIVSIMGKRVETQAEALGTGIKRYVVENLVNRIHMA